MRVPKIAVLLVLGHGLISFAQASRFRQPLNAVVDASAVIVLAEIVEAQPLADDEWKATAEVIETWKGTPVLRVEFVANRQGDPRRWGASTDQRRVRLVLMLTADTTGAGLGLRLASEVGGLRPVIETGDQEFVDIGVFDAPEARAVGVHLPNAELAVPLGWIRDYVKAQANEREGRVLD